MGVVWQLAFLCPCPLALFACLEALVPLRLHFLFVLAGSLTIEQLCCGHLHQVMQRLHEAPAGHCSEALHCWVLQGLAVQVETALLRATECSPDLATAWGRRVPGPQIVLRDLGGAVLNAQEIW